MTRVQFAFAFRMSYHYHVPRHSGQSAQSAHSLFRAIVIIMTIIYAQNRLRGILFTHKYTKAPTATKSSTNDDEHHENTFCLNETRASHSLHFTPLHSTHRATDRPTFNSHHMRLLRGSGAAFSFRAHSLIIILCVLHTQHTKAMRVENVLWMGSLPPFHFSIRLRGLVL